MAQTLAVALLVAACSLRAFWILAPAGVRRRVATALLAWRWPRRIADALRRHAQAPIGGCACDGCDAGTAKAKASPATVAPITFHRRLPR